MFIKKYICTRDVSYLLVEFCLLFIFSFGIGLKCVFIFCFSAICLFFSHLTQRTEKEAYLFCLFVAVCWLSTVSVLFIRFCASYHVHTHTQLFLYSLLIAIMNLHSSILLLCFVALFCRFAFSFFAFLSRVLSVAFLSSIPFRAFLVSFALIYSFCYLMYNDASISYCYTCAHCAI